MTVAQRIEHTAVRAECMDVAGPAIVSARLVERVFKPLQRDVTPLRIPLQLSGLGESVNLPRLNTHPPRCRTIRISLPI